MEHAKVKSHPKSHHYVSRFYLSYFATEELLWVCDKKTPFIKKVGIRDISCETYFNDIGSPGQRDFSLEDMFSKLESQLSPRYHEFLQLLDDGEVSVESMQDIALFVTISALRTKAIREKALEFICDAGNLFLKHPLTQEKLKTTMMSKFPELHEQEVASLLEATRLKINKDAEPNLHAEFVMLNLGLVNSVFSQILSRRWQILKYPGGSNYGFWTSDNPVSLYATISTGPYGLGFGTPFSNIAFPLSPRYCLVLYGDGLAIPIQKIDAIEIIPCDKNNLDFFNHLQCEQSFRQVYTCTSNTFLFRHFMKYSYN